MVPHDVVEIDIGGRRNGRGARRNIDHLSAASVLKLLRILNQRKSRSSLQDDQLVSASARRFDDEGGAGHRDGHRTGLDAAATGMLGDAEEARAAVDLVVASRPVETENGV